ncbi:type IV secretion system protein [Massilia sp. TW-1]|uniref:Type IV secretion system protein n=1 Tax=Telluria antibiotica TaxID=2717319 RepID=A0ABX0P8I2_9BURK|nr:type IV secretion system protein [Telluria antibiotica]NIA52540.1 type IV secretion system protein [Telluria antibiotica]
MNSRSKADQLVEELAATRALIDAHADIQKMLDLAADEADRRAIAGETSRRVAWRVAGSFGAVAIASIAVAGGAVATSMRPAPPPQVLVVDKANGVVQPLISLADFQMSPEEATIRRNVNTFVLAREGYSYEQADTHYYTAAAFMSPQLQAQWAQTWDKSNAESPPNRYKKERRVRVKIGAITVLRNGLGTPIGARASFTRNELVNDVEEAPTEWIANISFHWVNQPTNERDRRINDLGMEITDYTADRDLGTSGRGVAERVASKTVARQAASPMALVSPTNVKQVSP